MREPVRFADAVETLPSQGATTYLELGPDPVLCAMARECLGEEAQVAFVPTLREGRPEAGAIATAIAGAHAAGAKLDWGAFFEGTGAKRVPLPTYPFQRRHYWLASALSGAADWAPPGRATPSIRCSGRRSSWPRATAASLLTGRLSLADPPLAGRPRRRWHRPPARHRLPRAGAAGRASRSAPRPSRSSPCRRRWSSPRADRWRSRSRSRAPARTAAARSRSTPAPTAGTRSSPRNPSWTCHAQGVLSEVPVAAAEPFDAWPPEGAEPIEVEYLYDVLAEHGLEYGPAFQGLTAAWKDGEQVYVEVSLPEEQRRGRAGRFGIHPALLDSALHGIGLAAAAGGGTEAALLLERSVPAGVRREGVAGERSRPGGAARYPSRSPMTPGPAGR